MKKVIFHKEVAVWIGELSYGDRQFQFEFDLSLGELKIYKMDDGYWCLWRVHEIPGTWTEVRDAVERYLLINFNAEAVWRE